MANNNLPVHTLAGNLDKKQSATSKNGEYWQMVVDGVQLSLWDYDSGLGIKENDRVIVTYTVTEKGNKTYNNITTIAIDVGVEDVDVSNEPAAQEKLESPRKDFATVDKFREADADKYEIGMAKNNAAIIISELVGDSDVQEKNGEISFNWKKYEKAYADLVNALYENGKRIRNEKLGY